MADHDQQRLIELDANESPKVVFKVSYLLLPSFCHTVLFCSFYYGRSLCILNCFGLCLMSSLVTKNFKNF